jgi:hypothetical protein
MADCGCQNGREQVDCAQAERLYQLVGACSEKHASLGPVCFGTSTQRFPCPDLIGQHQYSYLCEIRQQEHGIPRREILPPLRVIR